MDINERIAKLEVKMNRVEEGVANFRTFQQDARDFFTEHRTEAREQERRRKERDEEIKAALQAAERKQDRKLAIIGIALACLTLFCGAIAALEAWHQLKTGELAPPSIFSSMTQGPAYASDKQDARIPPVRR